MIQAFEEESASLTGSNTPRDTVITSEIGLPDVVPEGTLGNSQALLDESSGKLSNLSYINQSKTIISHNRGTMPSSDLLGSSWDIESDG